MSRSVQIFDDGFRYVSSDVGILAQRFEDLGCGDGFRVWTPGVVVGCSCDEGVAVV